MMNISLFDYGNATSRAARRALFASPQVGDYVHDGRIALIDEDGAWQVDTGEGSYYLREDGSAESDVGVAPPRTDRLRWSHKLRPAPFWIFHNDTPSTGRRVDVMIYVRVWDILP